MLPYILISPRIRAGATPLSEAGPSTNFQTGIYSKGSFERGWAVSVSDFHLPQELAMGEQRKMPMAFEGPSPGFGSNRCLLGGCGSVIDDWGVGPLVRDGFTAIPAAVRQLWTRMVVVPPTSIVKFMSTTGLLHTPVR